MQLAAPILSKIVAGATVLFGVLVRHNGVEDGHHFAADLLHRLHRDHEQEIVTADMPHEAALRHRALHDIVQDLRQNADHAVAVVV